MDNIDVVSDKRDKVEENAHVKQALTMNGYKKWLIKCIPTILAIIRKCNFCV